MAARERRDRTAVRQGASHCSADVAEVPYFANETLNTQWSAAASSLSNATDIFFLGYSLPETDQMVRFMLSGLSLPELKTVWIVNQGSETEREAIFDNISEPCPRSLCAGLSHREGPDTSARQRLSARPTGWPERRP